MKALVLALFMAVPFASAQAGSFTCSLTPGQPVIEQTVMKLTVDTTSKEIQERTSMPESLGLPQPLKILKDETDAQGQRKISGRFNNDGSLACAGSCPPDSFELVISGEDAVMTKTRRYFMESEHSYRESKLSYSYKCEPEQD